MVQCHILFLLTLTDVVLGASLQSSFLEEREPALKPPSATAAVAQDNEEDLTHRLQRFGTNVLWDFSNKALGKLSSKDDAVQTKTSDPNKDEVAYDAPLRKFGGAHGQVNDTVVKQENNLPADPESHDPGRQANPSGLGDAIEERENNAKVGAPGAGGKDAPTIPGQNTDPLVPDADEKHREMQKNEDKSKKEERSWGEYGSEKWEQAKEYVGMGDDKEKKDEKIDGATEKSSEKEMVPAPTEAPVVPKEEVVPEAPVQKKRAPIEEPPLAEGTETFTAPPELGLPEDDAVATGKGTNKDNSVTAGLPTGRGGARMAQPWIFSVMMILILVCFCCGVCVFARHAKNSFRKTEDELRELLEKVKSTSMNGLMNEHAYGTPTPVPILRARHLVKKARDDQEDAKKEHRVSQYNAVRQAILDESYKMRIGKSKEELVVMDEEIRMKLRIEKEKIRAATIKDWAEGTLPDPVPSLPEVEAWLAKLEKRWLELQSQST